ncbi:histidine phosphatase family protein [Streptosporangium jomthongense]|uniref:Histidine phosphatase family protein n=1 Tax=Marinobacter aromaticivorans TaxID=1494078 RepID=A0ABW2IZT0_9GAMM|nr:histidine phosphatase family protein [Streptosporangium jomthongense]
MSSLLLVRHGQASFGGNRYDELSERGKRQASATGIWMRERGTRFDRILSGPRRRQTETAELILDARGSESLPGTDVLSSLDEFGEGEEILGVAEANSGLSLMGDTHVAREEVFRLYSEAYLAWFRGEGELAGRAAFSEFRKNVLDWFWSHTGQRGASGQKTLAVTSAGVISVIVCEVLGFSDERWPDFIGVLENASVTEVLYSGGRVGLRYFNSTGHLSPELLSGM